jgi:hypothetical protein
MNDLILILSCSSYLAFMVWEVLRPREVPPLAGMALSSIVISACFLFEAVSPEAKFFPTFTGLWIWGGLTVMTVSRFIRQITMVPSEYGLKLSKRDHDRALEIATNEIFKDNFSRNSIPPYQMWEDDEDLTGR